MQCDRTIQYDSNRRCDRNVHSFAFGVSRHGLIGWVVVSWFLAGGVIADDRATAYSESVVAKADSVLRDAGLRRSGQSLSSDLAAALAREISAIQRSGRELRLQHQEREQLRLQDETMVAQLRELQVRDGQLNLQLAQIAGGDVTTNNKLVAMINALRSQTLQLRTRRSHLRQSLNQIRSKLNEAEAAHAEMVFQLQSSLDRAMAEIDQKLVEKDVQIALQVMRRNFGLAEDINAAIILKTVAKRVELLAAEVLQETIELEKRNSGALMVPVSINRRPIEMVVDTGASVTVLPASAAKTLDLEIPPDAPSRNLVLANGQTIQAREILLPTVRIGQFQAEDVSAVILGPEADRTTPLLGMSYLERFKFEIDAAKQHLKLLRVEPQP